MAKIVVDFGNARLERERLFVVPDGLFRASETRQGTGERMVRVGGIPVEVDRAAKQTDRLVESTLLQPNDAQAKQGIEMVPVGLEHDRIQLLGLPKAPLVMEQDRPLKGV